MTGIPDFHELLFRLNRIGIALSNERSLDALFSLIVREARNISRAEGGTLYTIEPDGLLFRVSQNDVLSRSHGRGDTGRHFRNVVIPITKSSMSGYVALTGDVLNVQDVYEIPENMEYSFNRDFDKKNGYRTKSMLMVPLTSPNGQVLGLIQLVNAINEEGKVIPFAEPIESVIMSLASQAAVALRNTRLTDSLEEAYVDTLQRLSIAAEYRDDDTFTHIKRMSQYSMLVAQQMGCDEDEVRKLLLASPMHDIGKIGIPDAILQKPGKLTDEEFAIMKSHTTIGAKILAGAKSEILRLSEIIAISHHEKWDGSGYPNGLKELEIPIEGRIVAIADVFDALTSERCYKKAFSIEKAMKIIHESSGRHFDPHVVEAFDKCLDDCLVIRSDWQEPTHSEG